ncbi:MAG: hypothetical protein RBQ91_06195 [Acholeplasma sp.]|nr:hypothetical protein [Acholeplasma sp.]
MKLNDHAKVYIQKSAFELFYSMREKDVYTYIGLDQTLDLSRFILLDKDF